jgi:hypothetical protein
VCVCVCLCVATPLPTPLYLCLSLEALENMKKGLPLSPSPSQTTQTEAVLDCSAVSDELLRPYLGCPVVQQHRHNVLSSNIAPQ